MRTKLKCVCAVLSPMILLSGVAQAQDIGSPDPETLNGLYPGKHIHPTHNALSPIRFIGEKRTSILAYHSMQAYSAIS